MAPKRADRRRTAPRPSAASALLDGFFLAFSDNDGGVLAARICKGTVTGVVLAEILKWPRDKVSRRSDALRAGGVLEKHRDQGWMRMTPQLAGVEAAQAWVAGLRAEPPSSELTDVAQDQRFRRASLLADEGRRSLLTAMAAAPGSTQVQLVRACGLSQPLASRGLVRLVDGGFARMEQVHGRARYALRADAVEWLWAWTERTKATLAAGRETASRVTLLKPAPKTRLVAKTPYPPVQGTAAAVAPAEGPEAGNKPDVLPLDGGRTINFGADPPGPEIRPSARPPRPEPTA